MQQNADIYAFSMVYIVYIIVHLMFCNGKLIDRIIYKTTIISRLVHHRELHLFDGTRLLSKSRYDHVKAVAQLNDTQLADRYVST
jgi:hypothetical protein